MNGIKILGTGRGVPSKLVTNEDMAKIVDTNDEWITSRTGITHRHHLAEGATITDMTVLAARRAHLRRLYRRLYRGHPDPRHAGALRRLLHAA